MTMFQYKIDCIIHQKLFGLNVPTPFKGCLVKYLLKRRFAVRLLGDKVKENLHNTLILIIGKIHTKKNYSCVFFLSSLLLSSATVSYDTLTRWQLMAESWYKASFHFPIYCVDAALVGSLTHCSPLWQMVRDIQQNIIMWRTSVLQSAST